MADLKNEFSWSWSRHSAFSTCLRRYYLQHYAFWGGWSSDASDDVREIYIQKKLVNRAMWVGTEVHEAVEWTLGEVRRGRYPSPERVAERTRRRMDRAVEDSERGLYRIRPKRSPGFVEHYYDQEVDPGAFVASRDEALRQIEGVFTNPVFQRLTRVPERIREVEELRQVEVEGVPVWVSLDVLVDDGHGGLVVVDWKTGRHHDPDRVAAQLGIYGVYVLDAYLDAAPGSAGAAEAVARVKAMHVDLREGEHRTLPLTEEVLATAIDTITTSAAAMRDKLVDVTDNVARAEDFPLLPEGDPTCGRCPYRRTCGREG